MRCGSEPRAAAREDFADLQLRQADDARLRQALRAGHLEAPDGDDRAGVDDQGDVDLAGAAVEHGAAFHDARVEMAERPEAGEDAFAGAHDVEA